MAAVDVEANENVGAGQVVLMLASGDTPEVEVAMPESLIAQVHEGDEVVVRFNAMPERVFAANITEVGVAASGSTFPVTVRLVDGDSGVRSGMAADVSFSLRTKIEHAAHLEVPWVSVGEDQSGHFVFVLEETAPERARARRRPVTIGELTDLGIEIVDGLEAGERIATAGVRRPRRRTGSSHAPHREWPMNVTRFAIRQDRVTLILVAVLFLAGLQAFVALPRAEDPGFLIRTAQITTRFPGASPERVERLITDKLEKAIQEMPEVDSITSTSRTGISVIGVNLYESYSDLQPIWDRLRRKVERATAELPEGASTPLVDDEFGDVFGTIVMVRGDGYSYAELKEVADEVREELLLIDQVAKVEIQGTQEERVFVEYDNSRLAELGLSPGQLENILASRNILISGGEVRTPFETLVLEPSGNFETLDELGQTVVNIPGTNKLVYLGDIASIRRGYVEPPTSVVRFKGEPALALAVSMREGGNILDLGAKVKRTMDRLVGFYPIGIDFDYLQFQAEPVEVKVNEFVSNLLQAIVIVAVVMLLFLGLRTGLVVASLVPLAMVISLLIMLQLNIGLDQMSLAALIIALGMLVDNGIVVAESTLVQMEGGRDPVEAAVSSGKELGIPLLTSSLTTAAAFLPIYLADSAVGEFCAPLFKVVTITLLTSWALSLTIIPLLCARFLKAKRRTEAEGSGRLSQAYRRILITVLRNRTITLLGVVAAFALAIFGFRFIPNIFFPANDRPTFTAELKLPVGTPLATTRAMVEQVDTFIDSELTEAGITNWGSFVGAGAPRFNLGYGPESPSSSYAILILNTVNRAAVDEIIPRLERFCLETFPGLKPTIRPLESGPPSWPPVAVRLSGRDADKLFRIVDDVKGKLAELDGTKLIDDDWGRRSKKFIVNVDQPRALRAGVTSQDVAISLQTFMSGLVTTEYREGDDLIPVVLRSEDAMERDPERFGSLNIYAQASGESVPMEQVADVEFAWEPAKILRYNRLKTVTIEAGLDSGFTATQINDQLRPWLAEQQARWGLGYSWEFGGEAESSGEANASIGAKMPIAGLIIVMLLVAQFNSVRRPAIILFTIPLGIIGVVVGLLVTRLYFGFMTLLGLISLAGIVINNAIVLLDRIKIEQEDGLDPAQAVVVAAQKRMRPILLTTCTTIVGLVPLYLGGGSMFKPMAVAIMFGLLFATVLTLGVVPILYSVFFKVSFRELKS